MRTHTHTHTLTNTHSQTHTHVHTHTQTHTDACMHKHTCIHPLRCVHTHTDKHIHTCTSHNHPTHIAPSHLNPLCNFSTLTQKKGTKFFFNFFFYKKWCTQKSTRHDQGDTNVDTYIGRKDAIGGPSAVSASRNDPSYCQVWHSAQSEII